MKKKFQFRLEASLKMRKFKEKSLKIELGMIQKRIDETKNRIQELHQQIDHIYNSQEKTLNTKTTGKMIGFFPRYITGLREDIKNQETILLSFQEKYLEKKNDLVQSMGDVKVIDKLKEKAFDEHKKEVEKIEQNELEEIFMNRQLVIKDSLG